ncbi:phosphotransferase [uncultured Roseovarius sp.]|mgnify:CR=1 FL=1|uniref:phosphotransferase n=1 Tax=uncultured Roseovarius sp. TaxID=293344 RepID=UPI0025D07976|nr:phosphotransferase [uncultured Roseovarius sp.]
MSKAPQTVADDIERIMQVTERFSAAQTADPVLQTVEIQEILRLVKGKRAIIACRMGGRPAVVRMFLEDDPALSQREWNELERIWPFMSQGPYRVVEPFHHCPTHNLMVVERAEGTPLLEKLWQSDKADRARYLEPAARWLRLYTGATEEWRGARHRRWLAKAERAAGRQAFDALRLIESEIIALLHQMADRMDGAEWRTAISHGDFHPNNLMASHGDLVGIDTGGSARMPIYKDMARFLVHMGRRGMLPSGKARLGVDAIGLANMEEIFGLSAFERRFALPFMMGCEVLLRVETQGLSSSRIRRAEAMYAAFRDDLADSLTS